MIKCGWCGCRKAAVIPDGFCSEAHMKYWQCEHTGIHVTTYERGSPAEEIQGEYLHSGEGLAPAPAPEPVPTAWVLAHRHAAMEQQHAGERGEDVSGEK